MFLQSGTALHAASPDDAPARNAPAENTAAENTAAENTATENAPADAPQDSTREPEGNAQAETTKESGSRFRHSAIPLRSRSIDESLKEAQRKIQQGKFAAAVSSLRSVLANEADPQILREQAAADRQNYRSAKVVAAELLNRLPPRAFQTHIRTLEQSAHRALRRAIVDSDSRGLRGIPVRFPLTDAASESLQRIAARHLDRQELNAAFAALRRLKHQSSSRARDERQLIERQLHFVRSQKLLPERDTKRQSGNKTSHRPAPLRARLFPVIESPDWQPNGGLDEETTSLASHAFHEHFEQSIPVLPQARPLVIGDVVLTRVLNRIVARDLASGRVLWRYPPESPPATRKQQPASLLTMNLSLQDLMARRIGGELQTDSLHSRMTTDGERIFTVEWPQTGNDGRVEFAPHVPEPGVSPQNAVIARRLRNGQVEWRLNASTVRAACQGGSVSAQETEPDAADDHQADRAGQTDRDGSNDGNRRRSDADTVYFFGLPVPFDSMVTGLVQVGESVHLYAADRRTGEPVWMLPVAEASRGSAADAHWKNRDCRVASVDGVLICPTGAGLLVGVDPACRQVLWSIRAVRSDLPLDIARLPVVNPRPIIPWWKGWRDFKVLAVRGDSNAERHGRGEDSGSVAKAGSTEQTSRTKKGSGQRAIAIVAGPDIDGVSAINPRTGREIWHRAVESPIDLVSQADRCLIVQRHSIQSIDAFSGQTLWSVTCREPVGTGCLRRIPAVEGTDGTEGTDETVATWYVFPVRGGAFSAVNVQDGALLTSVGHNASVSGSMSQSGNRVVLRNSRRLTVWSLTEPGLLHRDPTDESGSPEAKTATSTTNQPATGAKLAGFQRQLDRALAERSAGLFSRAINRLRQLIRASSDDPATDGPSDDGEPGDVSPSDCSQRRQQAQDELRKTLLARLESDTLSGEEVARTASELQQLSHDEPLQFRIRVKHSSARAARDAGQYLQAFEYYTQLQSLNPSDEPPFHQAEVLRSVRHDRLIQGEILDLLAECDSEARDKIHKRYDELAGATASSADPFALQQFARRWFCLPIAADEMLDDRSRIGLRFGQKQLALLRLSRRRDRSTAEAARDRLRELFESRSYERDVRALNREGPPESSPDGSPDEVAQNAGNAGQERARKQRIGSPWAAGEASVSEHSERYRDTSFISIPVQARPGALFDRLNVSVNENPGSRRNETRVRFYGDGISGYWEMVLKTSTSPLKSIGQLARGWGIGHLLILQLGAELFAITPFDSSGEPRAQRVWSVDMAEGNRQEDHEYLPGVPGFSSEQFRLLDAFGRPIVDVGPVRASCACYRTRGKLVCLDTATGQKLWQRYEMPRSATVIGDEESVFAIEADADRVTTLRVVDGATESSSRLSDLAGVSGRVLQASGRRLLLGTTSDSKSQKPAPAQSFRELISIDLAHRERVWSRPVEPGEFAFAVGTEWLGIVSGSGELRLLDATTGRSISTSKIEVPKGLTTVYCSTDAMSHVLAFSTINEPVFLRKGGPRGRRTRNPKVAGLLAGIDAVSGKLLWQRPVDEVRFDRDQPKNAPCLVLTYRHRRNAKSSSTKSGSTQSLMHVIDRRSGEDILRRRASDGATSFTFEPHADQDRFNIRLERRSIRIEFAPVRNR